MRLVIYLPLVVPLLAAVAARPLAERLPPAAATWLLSVSALLLAAASSAVLGILALTAVVRVSLVDVLGKMSGQVIRSDDPASVPVALIAGAPGWPTARSCSGWPRSCARPASAAPSGSATSSPGWIRPARQTLGLPGSAGGQQCCQTGDGREATARTLPPFHHDLPSAICPASGWR